MPRQASSSHSLTQLGRKVAVPSSPEDAVLETVAKPHAAYDYVVRLTCPEFTSLCPITGQPDFAHIVIDYVPRAKLVESKSLKLFLQSFRNHGAFHEACTVDIGDRLIAALSPQWIRVCGYWFPRGGIPIDVFFQKGKLPSGVYVPEPGVSPYRGRG
ncbi:MAG: preQ(1) synthase [Bdellovibrionales bacterium]